MKYDEEELGDIRIWIWIKFVFVFGNDKIWFLYINIILYRGIDEIG